jgi:hypothetical protein
MLLTRVSVATEIDCVFKSNPAKNYRMKTNAIYGARFDLTFAMKYWPLPDLPQSDEPGLWVMEFAGERGGSYATRRIH